MVHAFGYGPGFGFGLGFLNFLGMVLFVILLVGVLRWVARGKRPWGARAWGGPPWSGWEHGGPGGRPGPRDEAVEVARERLAQGEITAEEFAGLRAGLEGSRPREEGPAAWFGARDPALRTARLRFARGEIDRETFDAVIETLAR